MMLMFTPMLIASILPPILFILAWILATRTMSNLREKLSPFECGFDPLRSARIPFSMRFFLLAIIFIVFDIEIVLLIPIPLLMSQTSKEFMLLSSMLFITILLIGLLYEWWDGSLNWKN